MIYKKIFYNIYLNNMGKSFYKNNLGDNDYKTGFTKYKKKFNSSKRNITKNLIKDDESKLKPPNTRHQKKYYRDREDIYSLNEKYNVGTSHEWNINKFESQEELIIYYIDQKQILLNEYNKKKLTINEEENWYDMYLLKQEILKVNNEINELKKIKKQLNRRNKYGKFEGHNHTKNNNF